MTVMNILILNPILYTPEYHGGKVPKIATIKHTMIYNYCLGFMEQGHKVTLIASEEYKPTDDTSFQFDIIFLKNSVKEKIKKFPNGFPYLAGLYSYLKRNKDLFDVIISSENFTYNSLVAAIVCHEKLIIWQEVGQHVPALHNIPSKVWHNTIARVFYRNVLVVPRSEIAQNFIKQYCPKVSVDIVDHGIDLDNFTFSADKQKYFVIVARLEWRKNIALTIDKFSRFNKKYGGYKLYIAGGGDEYENLLSQINREGLQEQVILTGFLSKQQLATLISGASCSLIDTIEEYNMVSISETIACGTPVITNTVPYSSYLINKYELGIVKDNWNEDDLKIVLDNLELYVENCRDYRHKLSTNYSTEMMINIFQQYNENSSNK